MSDPRVTVWNMTEDSDIELVQRCTICGEDVRFERPSCLDDHGSDCPEWICVQCGTAVLIGFALPDRGSAVRPSSHVA